MRSRSRSIKPWRSNLIVASKAVFCGFIIVLAFGLIANIRYLLQSDLGSHSAAEVDDLRVPSILDAGEILSEDGFWTFGSWKWELQSSTTDTLPVDSVSIDETQRPSYVDPAEKELLSLLVRIGASQHRSGSQVTYTLSQDEMVATVVAVEGARSTAWISHASLAIQSLNDGDPWTVYQIRRRFNSAADSNLELSILPPISGEVIAKRVASDRSPTAELRRGCGSVRRIKRRLETHGYIIEESRGSHLQPTFIAEKGTKSVVVRQLSDEAGGLLLVSIISD